MSSYGDTLQARVSKEIAFGLLSSYELPVLMRLRRYLTCTYVQCLPPSVV